MNCPRALLARTLLLASLPLALAVPATAQLDLPKPPPAPKAEDKENTAERLLRLGERPEVADPTLSRRTIRPGEKRREARSRQQAGGLDLPGADRLERLRSRAAGEAAPAPVPVPATQPVPAPAAPSADLSARDAALALLDQVQGLEVEDELVTRTEERLVALGDEGLAVARIGLASEDAAVLVLSARVLLRSSNPMHAPLVEGLLEMSLPRHAVAPLLESFLELAPVRATPALLGRLLDHPQSPMRSAAQMALEDVLVPEGLGALDRALESDRSDTRFRAVELLAGLDAPAATDRLLERVADGTPKVAQLAIDALSDREDPRIDHELLERTFAERWILTRSAYALLALIEREDELLRPVLDGRHVEPLLRGMTSQDAFVRGSCAAALAGIGFRGEEPAETAWLDREVPDALVTVVASQAFFPELSSLRGPATRRLTMIAGVSHGADAPAWAAWWRDARETFRASRAVLRATEADVPSLHVIVHSGPREDGTPVPPFQLVGPALDPSQVASHEGESLYLTEAEAGDLLDIARAEGLLDARRLPGVRGGTVTGARSIELRISRQAKAFVFGPRVREDWFERTLAACRAVAERNRWQRFPTPDMYPTRYSLWLDQHVWWSMEQDPRSRAERLESLVLNYAERRPSGGRSLAFRELDQLWSEPALRDPEDGERLLTLLGREAYYGEEARTLAHLVTRVCGFGDVEGPRPPVGDPRRGVMERLIDTLYERFAGAAAEELLVVLERLGPERVRGAARDPRPLVRGLCASLLASGEEDEDTRLLLELLADPDLDVREAAVLAAGEARVEAARESLLEITRDAPRALRLAALPALGRLGGPSARAALTEAMGEPEEDVKAAAAAGLAELNDPSTAPLLVSQLLRRGRTSPAFPAVRRALLGMGEEVVPDLMTAMRSSSAAAQREAALLLSELGEASAASVLLRFATEDPTDSVVVEELTVLSCVDNRREGDPSAAWWRWWDDVRKGDAFLWFLSAMELRGIAAPPRAEFEDGGSREALAFLMEGMARREPWLAERARRELVRMTGQPVDEKLPEPGPEREAWLETLFEILAADRQ